MAPPIENQAAEGPRAEAAPAAAVRTYAQASRDDRALRILAKTVYRELRQGGLVEEDVMAIAGELLSLVAGDMQDRRKAGALAEPPSMGPGARLSR
jgi:hypothetical protein